MWTVRLGDGTDESHRRMQAAIDEVWPFTHELFESDDVTRIVAASGIGVDPATLRDQWSATVGTVLQRATLRPADVDLAADRWTQRRAHRGPVLSAGRDAGAASRSPGCSMVDAEAAPVRPRRSGTRSLRSSTRRSSWSPSKTSGILRDVEVDDDGRTVITITPTYSGCPAMDVIRAEVGAAARAAGASAVEVRTVLAPPWTTDWISESGRAKLAAAAIAPPAARRPPARSRWACRSCR